MQRQNRKIVTWKPESTETHSSYLCFFLCFIFLDFLVHPLFRLTGCCYCCKTSTKSLAFFTVAFFLPSKLSGFLFSFSIKSSAKNKQNIRILLIFSLCARAVCVNVYFCATFRIFCHFTRESSHRFVFRIITIIIFSGCWGKNLYKATSAKRPSRKCTCINHISAMFIWIHREMTERTLTRLFIANVRPFRNLSFETVHLAVAILCVIKRNRTAMKTAAAAVASELRSCCLIE